MDSITWGQIGALAAIAAVIFGVPIGLLWKIAVHQGRQESRDASIEVAIVRIEAKVDRQAERFDALTDRISEHGNRLSVLEDRGRGCKSA